MQRKEFLSKRTGKAIKRKQLIICKLNENRNKIVASEQKNYRQSKRSVIFLHSTPKLGKKHFSGCVGINTPSKREDLQCELKTN